MMMRHGQPIAAAISNPSPYEDAPQLTGPRLGMSGHALSGMLRAPQAGMAPQAMIAPQQGLGFSNGVGSQPNIMGLSQMLSMYR
ncbi:hypothetical protein WJS89_10510 [Sphingomicrobium sp. XHP0235]|uniref:hypothetical protein n=1 Tax=Sphingomicrobium aquimarinum TaxID=3133971 RepID=UPI0031FECC2D